MTEINNQIKPRKTMKTRKTMKRNPITWAMPLAALCLLATACSKESNEPEAPQTRTLTIGCGIGANTPTPGTRAGVKPGNQDKTKESFIWHADDYFYGWLIPAEGSSYEPSSYMFNIDQYSDATPSNSAKFTCGNFPAGSYKMLATYLGTNSGPDTDGAVPYVINTFPQIGRNTTTHLKHNMKMYALAEVTTANVIPAMTFRHLASLVRFTVTNKNASPCRVESIRISSSENQAPLFGVNYSLKVTDWATGNINNECTRTSHESVCTTDESEDGVLGILLSAAPATDKLDTFDAYQMIGAGTTPLNNQKLLFQINVTDSDGSNSNNHTYTSLALDANKIIEANAKTGQGDYYWEPGKRYWFNLVLDEKLTVTLHSVSNLPGWGSDTEL